MSTPPPRVATTDDPVHRRNARLYLLGLAASLVGNSAMSLVAGIWVKSLTGSSSTAGAVAVCVYLPSLLSPAVGAWVDRVRRRPLLIGANLLSAAALLPLLAVRSADDVWIVFAVMLAYGLSLVVIDPAENALFSVMLPKHVREQVNGLRMALQEGGKFAAPLLGAGLFAVAGGGAVALADAATFVLAAAAIWALQVVEPPPRVGEPWRRSLTAGVRHVAEASQLRVVVLAAASAMVVAGIATPAQYGLVDALGRPPSFLGVLVAALGGGSIVASLLSARVIRRIGEHQLVLWALVNGAVGFALRATGSLYPVVAGSFVAGFALPWTVVAVVNLAQRTVPHDLQGRVFGVLTLALFAPQPLAQALGAGAIAAVDYRTVHIAAVVGCLATAAWLGRRQI